LGMQEVSESSAVQNMCKELVDQNAQGKWTQFQDLKFFVLNWIKGSCSFGNSMLLLKRMGELLSNMEVVE